MIAIKTVKKNSTPSLLTIVIMILDGSSGGCKKHLVQPHLSSYSQLVMPNNNKNMPKCIVMLNKKHHDTPLHLCAPLSLYGRLRNQSTIDELHNIAISVS